MHSIAVVPHFPPYTWPSLALGVLMLPAAVQAGPWEVGSISPSKSKQIKVEITKKHTSARDTWGLPVLKFAAPLNDDLSYQIATGYGIVDRTSAAPRGGAKDLAAKLKWLILDESEKYPALLLEPKLTLDTGDVTSGVSDGVTTLKTSLRAGKQFGKFHVTGEIRYTHGYTHHYDNIIGYGGLIEYAANERWTMGMDLLNDRPVHDSGRYHLRSNFALKLKATHKVEVQGLIGRSIENHRGKLATNIELVSKYKF